MDTTPLTLLEKLRQPRQTEAWDRFIRLYAPMLLSWAKKQHLQEADAADLTQNVLTKLIRLLPAYQRGQGQTFRSWLFTVARNESHDFRRRRATRPLPGAEGLSSAKDGRHGLEADDVDEKTYRRELLSQVLAVIRKDFSGQTWAAFTGVMLEGRPAREVAADLGLKVNLVHLARYRVMNRLRQEVDGLLD